MNTKKFEQGKDMAKKIKEKKTKLEMRILFCMQFQKYYQNVVFPAMKVILDQVDQLSYNMGKIRRPIF